MKIEEHKKLAEEHFDGYVSKILRTHGEPDEVVMKCRFHFISAWVHGVKHEQDDKGIIQRAESKKTIVATNDSASIPVKNTSPENEPKKKTENRGKTSNFMLWFNKLELGTRFTEEEFFKLYPRIKSDVRGRARIPEYISKLISERRILQHPKNILEKIKE